METYEREWGIDHYGAFALRGLALVEALEGNVAEARRLSLRGLELADGEGDLVVANLHRGILGVRRAVDERHRGRPTENCARPRGSTSV